MMMTTTMIMMLIAITKFMGAHRLEDGHVLVGGDAVAVVDGAQALHLAVQERHVRHVVHHAAYESEGRIGRREG